MEDNELYYTHIDTPAGTLLLTSDGAIITGLHWVTFRRSPIPSPAWQKRPELFAQTAAELNEYFNGRRTTFKIDYRASGTPFQEAVWKELENIPFGVTTTYSAIAAAVGRPNAVRAVGTAVGSNPVSIIIPCHRVIASNGKLGGYAGGLESKRVLFGVENISA